MQEWAVEIVQKLEEIDGTIEFSEGIDLVDLIEDKLQEEDDVEINHHSLRNTYRIMHVDVLEYLDRKESLDKMVDYFKISEELRPYVDFAAILENKGNMFKSAISNNTPRLAGDYAIYKI
jgi:hypothetical protein